MFNIKTYQKAGVDSTDVECPTDALLGGKKEKKTMRVCSIIQRTTVFEMHVWWHQSTTEKFTFCPMHSGQCPDIHYLSVLIQNKWPIALMSPLPKNYEEVHEKVLFYCAMLMSIVQSGDKSTQFQQHRSGLKTWIYSEQLWVLFLDPASAQR